MSNEIGCICLLSFGILLTDHDRASFGHRLMMKRSLATTDPRVLLKCFVAQPNTAEELQ